MYVDYVADALTTATFQGENVDWYIKTDDAVLENKNDQSAGNHHIPNNLWHKK